MRIDLLILLLATIAQVGFAQQTYTDKTAKEFSFKKQDLNNTVVVANINGNVKVMGYGGDVVILEIERTINARTVVQLEKGKHEIQLGVMDRADSLIFYLTGPCNKFGRSAKNNNRWDYEWHNCQETCREEFEYTTNFTLKVPSATQVTICTVNNGDLIVDNVRGKVRANNINGSIKLTNLTQAAVASTINGNLDIEYAHNPEEDCRFYSLNGDINANFQKGRC